MMLLIKIRGLLEAKNWSRPSLDSALLETAQRCRAHPSKTNAECQRSCSPGMSPPPAADDVSAALAISRRECSPAIGPGLL
eukprot:CAMPEP_0178377528 /NCGR_PEP_ID=MMETSP0689_2-20121128/3965_1 /TAXON_ID=160604 /ORGANISM="Amphidinium massartii, Strain CS-259" /LENGTH=80 /DNA_ID=CAMNT_0019997585 /DNA_START=234 /DNA_END=476 /DNA_ORIENTATION=+